MTGELAVAFSNDMTNETFTVRATIRVKDDDTLNVTFEKWPIIAKNGRFKGTLRRAGPMETQRTVNSFLLRKVLCRLSLRESSEEIASTFAERRATSQPKSVGGTP